MKSIMASIVTKTFKEMDHNINIAEADKAKKKIIKKETWKREKEKVKRYSAKDLPHYPTCEHRRRLQCRLLSMKDIKDFHDSYYCIPEKIKQDAFILKFCRSRNTSNRSIKSNKKPKELLIEYSIKNQAGVNLKVCRSTFINALNITKHRIIGVFKRFKIGLNEVPVETRGGDRKKEQFKERRESVINFIKNLKASESHYAREKSSRLYLPSELNIIKLWKMYLDSSFNLNYDVKESYFRSIFNTNFNIGFSSPSVDECSTCIELKHRIEIEKKDEAKTELEFKLKLHKKKAKCFFEYLKYKPENCYLISYDCQKNLPLPKLTDQSAYYSRQFYCYNLSVTKGVSTDSLTPENVLIYTWTEDEGKKSSNEVASVVFDVLNNSDLSEYATVRLVADGCPGQNKNVNILCMVSKWLGSHSPQNINSVELIYPVTGHSFMPADRVFGSIERDLKKMSTILLKEEYHKVFEARGTLKFIGVDWTPYNWKEEAKKAFKSASQLHFKLSLCRRVIIRKTKRGNIVVRGEQSYNMDTGTDRGVFKTGKCLEDICPLPLPIGVSLKSEKIRDVEKLLCKHFGDGWKSLESLQWYCSIIDQAHTSGTSEDVQVESDCECCEELSK